jgi:hypothetical protein
MHDDVIRRMDKTPLTLGRPKDEFEERRMKKTPIRPRMTGSVLGLALIVAGLMGCAPAARTDATRLAADLKGSFDLAGERTPEILYFRQETEFVHIGFDGKRTGSETYVVTLRCVPAALSGKSGDEYTSGEFQIRLGDAPATSIPALAGWSYVFAETPTGMDEKGQVFGIPHAKFEELVDSRGNRLPVGIRYAVYNNFIDFHAFNDAFARPTKEGGGIQDLKRIGQKIVHAAAFSEPPVNLGSGIKPGSVFRNGEVILEFKGVAVVDAAPCAVVGYSSGESTLRMIMPLAGAKDMETVGGSQYTGDLYIDLGTRWVRKVTMDEFVVTETRFPGPAPKVDAYTVRHLLIRMISQAEFEQKLS